MRQGGSGVPVSILPVFNLFFVSFYQNILLLLITLPVYAAWRHAGTPLNRIDALAFLLCSGFLALETAADHQMWNFQVTTSQECVSRGVLAMLDGSPLHISAGGAGAGTTALINTAGHPRLGSLIHVHTACRCR